MKDYAVRRARRSVARTVQDSLSDEPDRAVAAALQRGKIATPLAVDLVVTAVKKDAQSFSLELEKFLLKNPRNASTSCYVDVK